jgi:hypothetical protein
VPIGSNKDYEIGICCLSAKHTALQRKSKDWLARNHDNVSEWGDMSILIKKEMLKIKIDGLYEAGLKELKSTRHKLVQKYGQIFQEQDELRSTAIENLQKFIKDAEYSALSSEQILNQKSMITLLNLGLSERNQMHDLIAMDLKVFDDKSAFKVIDNDVNHDVSEWGDMSICGLFFSLCELALYKSN